LKFGEPEDGGLQFRQSGLERLELGLLLRRAAGQTLDQTLAQVSNLL
jgi:hypothetical protein